MIDVNALRPADIIVSTTNAAVSAVIRAGIGSSVSHSMIYIGGSTVIEAVERGAQAAAGRSAQWCSSGDRVTSSQSHGEAASRRR